ncbi:EFR1 family ferrodoxin [Sunxiuqinia sp. sy24]|uniref:EFR1 family ferrodoxin n=1 Tax=Sunxiuqinia sp. sy24 TaxID=3461495 RepID=UPI00404598CE
MITQIHTLFFSPTETTAKVAGQITSGLDIPALTYNLTAQKDRNQHRKLSFNSDDLLLLAVPVYAGRIPEFLEELFSTFEGHNTPVIFTVVYGNRDYDDALLELKDLFEKRGFTGIAAGAFIGEHSYTAKVATNRPDAEDLSAAFQFGQEIKATLSRLDSLKDHQLIVKGNFPYKERKPMPLMTPETNEKCTDCGICAETCPMDAIEKTDNRTVHAKKCIRCNSCVKKCPENAKSFSHKIFIEFSERLIQNCSSVRKKPELFFL